MSLLIKICGLKTEDTVAVAVEAGADMLGLNFHPKSPRYVTPERAAMLAMLARGRSAIVALAVDPSDAVLSELLSTVSPDLWQFHGQEVYERIRDVRAVYGLPVMKAVGVAERADLAALDIYQHVADQILVDAKPPKGAALPGGNGLAFDWTLLLGRVWRRPWMLAGGLTPDNVALAVRSTNARQVDVSSGVETAPGVKDEGLIRAFVAAARSD